MPGPAKKPSLQVVREGNPGKRPIPEQIVVPPATFDEPDWLVEFPVVKVPRKPVRPRRSKAMDDDEWADALVGHQIRLENWERQKLASESSEFSRARAAEEWNRVVPVLKASVGVGNPDYSTVLDLCVCVARLDWCEAQISREGLIVMGQRGPCKNPLTTIATAYRTQFKTYIRELGLSPSARTGLNGRQGGDDDDSDPFD